MVLDLEAAKGQLRSFGSTATGSMRTASAELSVLKTGTLDNTRAMAQFLTQTLKLGPVMAAAFPIVGLVALTAGLVDAGKKLYDLFQNMQNASKKTAEAFQSLNAPLQLTNDQLRTSNDRLDNELAKLAGKPQNNVKTAIDDIREASDKLTQSLHKSFVELEKLLKENHTGVLERLGGSDSTADIEKSAREFGNKIDKMNHDASEKIRTATRQGNDKAIPGIHEQLTKDLKDAYAAYIPTLTTQITAPPAKGMYLGDGVYQKPDPKDSAKRLNMLNGLREHYEDESDNIGLEDSEAKKKGKLPGAETDAKNRTAAAERLKKDQEQTAKLAAELAGAQEAALAGGHDIIAEINQKEQQALSEAIDFAHNNRAPGAMGPSIPNSEQQDLIHQRFDTERATEYKKVQDDLAKGMIELDAIQKQYGIDGAEAMAKVLMPSKEQIKAWDDMAKALEKVDDIQTESAKKYANRQASHAEAMAGLSGLSAEQAINEAYSKRIDLAENLAAIEQQRIDKEEDAAKRIVLEKQRQADLEQAMGEAEDQREEKLAQLRKQQIDELTNPLISGMSGQMANLMTGQKTNFGKMLKDTGHSMVQSGLQKAMHFGVDKLTGTHKPTGSPNDPISVRVVAGSPTDILSKLKQPSTDPNATPDAAKQSGNFLGMLSGLIPGLGGLSSLFGGSKTSVSSSVSFPMLAEGGSADPGSSYIVGESAPELFTPRTAGQVTPMHKLQAGGNGDTHYNIDARGAALGTENRIARAIEASHASAVSKSVQANHQRQKRTVQRSK